MEDLPYAPYLESFDGDLVAGGDHTEVWFADAEFADADAGGSRVSESALTGVAFTNGRWLRSRFSEVWLDRTRWVGTNLSETNWLDATVLRSLFAGVEGYGATLRRVTFQECKFSTLNLRGATLKDVVFDRCELSEVDFGQAELAGVRFPGSALRRARFDAATLREVDLRGATDLDLASGCESLRGAVVTSGQLLELAPALARALGILVNDG